MQAITASVQQVHAAVSDTVFSAARQVPGLAGPTRLARAAHDTIAGGVYGAIRHGTEAASQAAGHVERLAQGPEHTPGATEQAFRSALGGVVGDALLTARSSLAIDMVLRRGAEPLAITPDSLAVMKPRVCVFVHGLGCNESSWWRQPEAWGAAPASRGSADSNLPVHYGALLEQESGVSSIFLRYNTGLSINANAAQLADLLERVSEAAPQVSEWVLIGHSMGGLLVRGAHDVAVDQRMRWAERAPLLICLGSPHRGAPLERIGRRATQALASTAITRPLGRLAAARSQGIRDLHDGHRLAPRHNASHAPALRFVAATLAADPASLLGKALSESIGDGLVPTPSATDEGAAGDVQRVVLAGLNHMDLLNHPRVYEWLRRWVHEREAPH